MPFVEGDDLHPKANIDKMARGSPLTDADREPWLELIRTTAEHMIVEQQAAIARGERAAHRRGVMVTCSALKRYYRDILRGTYTAHLAHLGNDASAALERGDGVSPTRLPVYFVYIKGELPLLRDRMAHRQGHFMKPEMLDSQLAALESPEGEEGVIVVPLGATTEQQVDIAMRELRELVGELGPAEPSMKPEVVKVPEELRVLEPALRN